MVLRKLASLFILYTLSLNIVNAQNNRLTTPVPRITNADITVNAAGSYCGSLTQSVQAAPGAGSIYYTGDTLDIQYRLATATTATLNINLIQYSSQGTAGTLPTVANVILMASVASQQATSTPATVTVTIPNVVCRNIGDCAIAWTYTGAPTYYSCADIYVLSRANDATLTFFVNRGTASVPLGATLRTRFLNYFNAIYGTFRSYNVRGPGSDPVADGNGNYAVAFTLSDGPIGWVNALNMSYQVQYEVSTNNAVLSASIFGAGSNVGHLDVNDADTRAKEPSTSNAAIAVIIIFLIIVAILLGVWYYYWKYQPAKLRGCMERACPCFLSSGSAGANKPSTYMTSTNTTTAPAQRGAPTAAAPNRAQINI